MQNKSLLLPQVHGEEGKQILRLRLVPIPVWTSAAEQEEETVGKKRDFHHLPGSKSFQLPLVFHLHFFIIPISSICKNGGMQLGGEEEEKGGAAEQRDAASSS